MWSGWATRVFDDGRTGHSRPSGAGSATCRRTALFFPICEWPPTWRSVSAAAEAGRDRVGAAARHRGPDRPRTALPAPAVGRPAAAGGAGPGAGHRTRGGAARRAVLVARRRHARQRAPGGGPDPAGPGDHDRARHPRPGRGAVDGRPGGGAPGRPDRGRSPARAAVPVAARRRPGRLSSARPTCWPGTIEGDVVSHRPRAPGAAGPGRRAGWPGPTRRPSCWSDPNSSRCAAATPCRPAAGSPARVVDRAFFGHDAVLRVAAGAWPTTRSAAGPGHRAGGARARHGRPAHGARRR